MTGSYIRRMLLLGVPSVLFTFGLAAWLRGWPLGVDSSVYRAGAALFLHGHSPYEVNDLGYLGQSFTYPPAAALLFTPLAFLPAQLGWAVMASASALALAIGVAITAVPYWRFPPGWSALLLTATTLCLLPVYHTIGLGQVNLLLMAMVTVDVLAATSGGSRWGGLLTGIAAAVFLVPLIFIPHLFLTGKRAAAARALAVFAGLQGLALVIVPQDSAYWATYMFQIGRIGHPQIPDNQSLDGVIARVTDASAWSVYAAWAIGAVLAVPALLSWLQLTWHRAERRGGARWQRWAAVIAVIAVFTSTPISRTSQQRPRALSTFWYFILSNPYVLTTIAIALILGICWLRHIGSPPVGEPIQDSAVHRRNDASGGGDRAHSPGSPAGPAARAPQPESRCDQRRCRPHGRVILFARCDRAWWGEPVRGQVLRPKSGAVGWHLTRGHAPRHWLATGSLAQPSGATRCPG